MAHLLFFQTHKAKQKTSKEPPSQRTKTEMNKQRMTKIKHEPVTCGIFYCRVSAEINDCGSLQTSSRFESDVLRNRQQKHTAVRYQQA